MPFPQRGNSVTTLTVPSVGHNSRVAPHPSDGTRPLGILIVDDEDPVRRILGLGLQAQGFVVWLAADAMTAVELYLGHHDAIDVVLLDVRMPDRDGPETLAALREIDPHVTCCFMSGDTGEYTQKNLLDFGVVAVFQKPFRLRELARQLIEIASPIDRPVAFQ
jgi:DNA-binding response OmpR family regulator